MALVVEDGTGLTNANSYISVADADTYHSDRAHTDWGAASAGDKESALINATQYIDGKYRTRWRGWRGHENQRLAWPRYNVVDSDGWSVDWDSVPVNVQYATAEAALLIIQGEDLSPSLERGGRVVSESVGPISTTYDAGAPAVTVYLQIQRLLGDLINGPSVRVTR